MEEFLADHIAQSPKGLLPYLDERRIEDVLAEQQRVENMRAEEHPAERSAVSPAPPALGDLFEERPNEQGTAGRAPAP